uniref:Uncharacterized protein n=1 Tax=Aspergillus fumigatus TaxID=746128 RepID=Q6MYD6_ASPFM|nr:hypothetical protein AfA34E6.035 [Aspergillus fumigatus]
MEYVVGAHSSVKQPISVCCPPHIHPSPASRCGSLALSTRHSLTPLPQISLSSVSSASSTKSVTPASLLPHPHPHPHLLLTSLILFFFLPLALLVAVRSLTQTTIQTCAVTNNSGRF